MSNDRRSFLKKAGILSSGMALFAGAAPAVHTRSRSNDRCLLGKRRIIDPDTGRPYWQMTDGHCDNTGVYGYSNAFTRDEKHIVFTSFRTGLPQLHAVEIESGESRQLGFFEDYTRRPIVRANSNEVFIRAAGPRIWSVDAETGYTRQVADLSHRSDRIGGFALNGDGTRFLVTYLRKEDGYPALALGSTDEGRPEEVLVFEPHPRRNRIENVSHPQFNPVNSNLISIVLHPDMQGGYPYGLESLDLPAEMRARAWLIDLQQGSRRPFVVTEPGWRATHEFWGADGSRMYYHKKNVPGTYPTSILSVDVATNSVTEHIESESIYLGHSIANAQQTHILSDSQARDKNALYWIDARTGAYEILNWPNTSNTENLNHIHPGISPSGRRIVYTSDVSGSCQIYMIDLQEER